MSEENKDDPTWPVAIFLIVVVAAFYFFGMWVGILSIVIGLPIIGWGRRHDGPFPTNKNKD